VEVKFAVPVGSRAAVPSVVDPLVNVTVPVGTLEPAPAALTTDATNSTGKPCVDAAVELANESVVARAVTVTDTEAEVDAA
jgi:hypothetical protein